MINRSPEKRSCIRVPWPISMQVAASQPAASCCTAVNPAASTAAACCAQVVVATQVPSRTLAGPIAVAAGVAAIVAATAGALAVAAGTGDGDGPALAHPASRMAAVIVPVRVFKVASFGHSTAAEVTSRLHGLRITLRSR
jgi:hypothetical protein